MKHNKLYRVGLICVGIGSVLAHYLYQNPTYRDTSSSSSPKTKIMIKQIKPEKDVRLQEVVGTTARFKVCKVVDDYLNSWVPRSSDVIITTAPKTGTTWLQMTCHQLRTGGDLGFEEICQVVPWIKKAYECGQDLNGDQKANPRVYKAHQRLSCIHEGCKYITTIRDPISATISWYHIPIPYPHMTLISLITLPLGM